jgi:hypothetical protein
MQVHTTIMQKLLLHQDVRNLKIKLLDSIAHDPFALVCFSFDPALALAGAAISGGTHSTGEYCCIEKCATTATR